MHVYLHLFRSCDRWVPEKQEATTESSWHIETHVCTAHTLKKCRFFNSNSSKTHPPNTTPQTNIWKETFHTKYSLPIIFALEIIKSKRKHPRLTSP